MSTAGAAAGKKGASGASDSRFDHVHSDPRFKRAPKAERKFQPDARFQKMFTDKSFSTNYKVDAWGRKIETGKAANELLKYYEMDEETRKVVMAEKQQQEGENAAPAAASKVKAKKPAPKAQKSQPKAAASKKPATASKKKQPAPSTDEDDEGAGDDDDNGSEGFDGNFMSDRAMAPPSSAEEEDEDEEDEDEMASAAAEEEEEVPAPGASADTSSDDDEDENIEMEVATEEEIIPTGDQTSSRLAVQNLEWDRLSSVDLLVLFRSFVPQPPGAVSHPVKCVKVYPSQFGRERMADEAKYGPTSIYANGRTAEEVKRRIDAKASKIQIAEEDNEDEAAEHEEDESERSDEEEDDDEAADGPKRKRVSFPAGTKNSKKKVTKPAVVATPAKPSKKVGKKQETEEDEADREATDDILANPSFDDTADDDDDNDDASSRSSIDAGNEFDSEKLRAYELERLKYYYAIVECDSAASAEQLYRACDGMEFEHSSNVIDLRYVPDDVDFTEEEAYLRDQCSKVPSNYRAPEFATQALQHTKVQLTWDRDDPVRAKLLQRKFTADDEAADDLKAYLGSDNEEDGYGSDALTEASDSGSDDPDAASGDEGKPKKRVVKLKRKARSKYLALLKEIKGEGSDNEDEEEESEDDDGNHEVTITFEPGLKAKGEEIARKALNKGVEKEESTWERHLRERQEKKKAKKKARKEKLKGETTTASTGGDEDSGDEIGGPNQPMESDLYQDDEVEFDPDDEFFKLSDEEELEAPIKGGKKGAIVSDDEDDDAISMSSESGEEFGGNDDEDDDEDMGADDDDDIDALHGKAKAQRFFDDRAAPKPKAKAKAAATAAVPTADKKKGADKKRKRGDDSTIANGGDDADAAREKAELELLMIDESPEEGEARGYSLNALLKQKKSAMVAEAGGKRSKKAKREAAAAAAAPVDDFKVNTRDERFGALFNNDAFSIDPTHPAFKPTEGTDQLLHEKARRRAEREKEQAAEIARRKQAAKQGGKPLAASTSDATVDGAPSTSNSASLAAMVASVKRKAQQAAAASKKPTVAPVGTNKAPASKRSKPDTNL